MRTRLRLQQVPCIIKLTESFGEVRLVFGVGHEVAHTLDWSPLVSRLNYSDRHTCVIKAVKPIARPHEKNFLNELESD